MKRLTDYYLLHWKEDKYRKPLIIFGARQVGKTYSVRNLGSKYQDFVEINFEKDPQFSGIFLGDLDPNKIIKELEKKLNRQILTNEHTLLFLDEIQIAPRAILALRYFYEMMPQLHVIAAGSLLEFAIQEVGMPVGRVSPIYFYPMSFLEFLAATGENSAIDQIINHEVGEPISEILHEKFLKLFGQYVAIGGMPEAVQRWVLTKDLRECFQVHTDIINLYRRDFNSYNTKLQVKYLQAIFDEVPRQLGHKFKYEKIDGQFKKSELVSSFELLETLGIINKIVRSPGTGIPLGSGAKLQDFKAIFLDLALSQAVLGLDLDSWLIDPFKQFVNKGELIESLVGQEILAYNTPHLDRNLYYWQRETTDAVAEVDYLIQQKGKVVPIEVKSNKGTTLKSLHEFLNSHSQTDYGIRFSTNNYSFHEKIYSYPLYAVAKALCIDIKILRSLL